MPFTRCRYYDDNGRPHGAGCRTADCGFIHPSSPNWARAPKPKIPFTPRGRGGGWSGRGRGDGGGGRGSAWDGDGDGGGGDTGWGGRRRSDTTGSSSTAAMGWGQSFGGSSWDTTTTAASGSNQAGTSAASDTSGWRTPAPAPSTVAAPPPDPTLDWGAPTTDWGTPSADWGAPPPAPGSWGDPTASALTPAPAGQQSPDQEKKAAEAVIWGDPAKGKEANVTSTPQWATPRTPRSPDRSPQRERVAVADPRRRPSIATNPSTSGVHAARAMSPSDEAAQSILAKEVRKGEARIASWGVPLPVPIVGEGGSTTNPFAFTDYTPAKRIDVDPPEPVEDLYRQVNMDEFGSTSRTGSKAPSRASSPISPVVDGRLKSSLDEWKDFTRLLTKAVALSLDLTVLNETQAKQRAMQRSARYRSASMAVAHAQLERVRAEHDAKLRRAQRKFDDCLTKLAAFPADGPPAEADPALPPEVESWRQWAASTMLWVEEVRPLVEQRLETERAAAQAKQQEEEARAAEMEATARAMEEAQARVELVNSQVNSLEEQVTDLEHQVEELRIAPTGTADVVATILPGRKDIVLPFEPPDASQRSIEEGEVRAPPRKTHRELTKECARLERKLQDREARFSELLKQVEEEKDRNRARKIAYHELAAENAEMQFQLSKLTKQQKSTSDEIQKCGEELASLHKKLQEYQDREPPPPPPAPTSDQLAAHIIPELRPVLRGALHDGLGAVRRGVDAALAKQQEDICMQVWQAFQPVMRIIQQVKSLADHQPGIFMPAPPPPVQNVQHS